MSEALFKLLTGIGGLSGVAALVICWMAYRLVTSEKEARTKETEERKNLTRNIRVIFDDNYPLWTWRWLLSREYRLRRAYWWSVMQAATIAISGDEARKAWIDAHNRRQTICA